MWHQGQWRSWAGECVCVLCLICVLGPMFWFRLSCLLTASFMSQPTGYAGGNIRSGGVMSACVSFA